MKQSLHAASSKCSQTSKWQHYLHNSHKQSQLLVETNSQDTVQTIPIEENATTTETQLHFIIIQTRAYQFNFNVRISNEWHAATRLP